MQRAFSLVELSIVLVILGLLTGGILAGQSLIKSAELRSVGEEYKRWQTATGSFRDKYFGWPGDISNATKFWGTGTCSQNNRSPGVATCDGDSSGILGYNSKGSNENFTFWQQLANAGLVEGSYSGTSADPLGDWYDGYISIGVNSPRSKFSKATWYPTYIDDQTIATNIFFEGSYGPTYFFGGSTTGPINVPMLTPEQAWNIDSKLDDGLPGTGLIRTYEYTGDCHDAIQSTTAARAGTARYKLTYTGNSCTLFFKM